jgi:succinyl-CoA synthetase beta subunit
VKTAIKSVAQMLIDNKEITECDINPLVVSEDNNIFAVDVRIKC